MNKLFQYLKCFINHNIEFLFMSIVLSQKGIKTFDGVDECCETKQTFKLNKRKVFSF
jgi:hypothetical protein